MVGVWERSNDSKGVIEQISSGVFQVLQSTIYCNTNQKGNVDRLRFQQGDNGNIEGVKQVMGKAGNERKISMQ